MRTIAHFLPWTGVGGTEHATLRIACAVAEHYRSIFFCREDAGEVEQFFRDAGHSPIRYSSQEPSYRNPLPYLRASWKLAGQLRRERVDIVHAADWTGVQYAALATRLAGCRLISHVRNRNESIPKRDWRPLRLVDRFVFVSSHTAQGFGYPAAARRATVLYDGIPTATEASSPSEVRSMLGLPANSRLIAMAARVAKQKDYPTLIAAVSELASRHPGIRIVILGDHDRQPEHREHFQFVQEHLRRHNAVNLFQFTGFRTDVTQLLGGMDIFVLSTHWEGLPLVILEAMAQGLPVVATAVDGIPEVVATGQTGFTVPHEDAGALAEALDKLLTNPDLARAMGEAGRRRVQEYFSPAQFRANLLQLYDSILATTTV